jgi:UDP-glucuronate 4-epimerase
MSARGTVLVTGAAGFIGSMVAARLASHGWRVLACDNYNAYYPPTLKHDRVAALLTPLGVRCEMCELADADAVEALFAASAPDHVVHLAAQAGVRYSLEHPGAFVQSNLVAFSNVLDACRRHAVRHLVYASSSSVYGANARVPFQALHEDEPTDAPLSFYAATKKANEAMAYAGSHVYGLPATGLRFFTVYGPWGRPDMAYYRFARSMLEGEPIKVYGEGKLLRDFTYIDDVAEAVARVLDKPPRSVAQEAPHRILNIGNQQSVLLTDFIATLERVLGVAATRQLLPMQPGDMTATCADTTRLHALAGWVPATPLAIGLADFASWFRTYHASGAHRGERDDRPR